MPRSKPNLLFITHVCQKCQQQPKKRFHKHKLEIRVNSWPSYARKSIENAMHSKNVFHNVQHRQL